MGVVFARFPEGDRIIGIARNAERGLDEAPIEDAATYAETATTGPEEPKEDVNE